MSNDQDILNWLGSQQAAMVELLTRWSNINTGSYNTAGLGRFAEELVSQFSSLSTHIETIPLPPYRVVTESGQIESRPLGKAIRLRSESASTASPQVFLGIHYDTVFGPADVFQTASQPDAGSLRGPGVCDAKGGLVILLYSMLALQRFGRANDIAWEILLNPDEEIGSPGSAPLFREAATRNDCGLLFEPALPDGALVSARRGSGGFSFIVRGKSAHSGRDPHLGRNAIHAMARFIARLSALEQEIPGILINTGIIRGGTAANVVPDLAYARVMLRIEDNSQRDEFDSRLKMLITGCSTDGITIEPHGGFGAPPKPLTPPTEKLLHAFRDCASHLSMPPLSWRPTGGTCDGNRLAAAGLPTIDSLGPRGGGMHTHDEFIQIESLVERARLVTLFMLRVAAGDIRLDPAPACA